MKVRTEQYKQEVKCEHTFTSNYSNREPARVAVRFHYSLGTEDTRATLEGYGMALYQVWV